MPTQAVADNSRWKPENQVLIASLVVPVFPAISERLNIFVFLPLLPLRKASLKISLVINAIFVSIELIRLSKGGNNKNGFIVNDFEQLTTILRNLIDNENLLTRNSEGAILLAKRFDWKIVIREWENLIYNLR